jgi:cell division protein ZapA
MSKEIRQEQIKLLGKEYTIVCPPDERHALLDSAALLNQKMQEIRNVDRVMSMEKIAVMAALNLAHELIVEQKQEKQVSASLTTRIEKLNEQLSRELGQFSD